MPAIEVEARRLRVEGLRWSTLLAGLRQPRRFFRELVRRIMDDRTFTFAAALAYYFFFALSPFLLFLVAAVSVLPVRGLDDWILGQLGRVVPGEAYGMLEGTIRSVLGQRRGGLLSLGAVLTLWSASGAFASIIDALDLAYRVHDGRPWWRVRLEAIALTLGLSVFMIVGFTLALFGGPLVAYVASAFGPGAAAFTFVLRWLVALGAVTVVIAVLYYYGPDVEQRHWRWVTPGSVVFTAGFALTSAAFSYYVTHFGSYDKMYGSLGAVIILLLWLYLIGFFLLLGGQLNALLEHTSPAGKSPGEKVEPPAEVQGARITADERARA